MARVDLWILDEAEASAAQFAASDAWLGSDERQRASRFLREDDRRRFVLARGLVRAVLGRVTGIAPAALAFDVQPHGKPVLRDGGVHFNLSHTRGMIALALSREVEVGVDVEAIDRRLDPLRLAARNFSASENAALADAEASQQPARFIEIWTLKEAYVKALGRGLQHDLRSFSASLAPPSIIDHVDGVDRPAACRCWLDQPAPGFRLALVARDAAALDIELMRGFPE